MACPDLILLKFLDKLPSKTRMGCLLLSSYRDALLDVEAEDDESRKEAWALISKFHEEIIMQFLSIDSTPSIKDDNVIQHPPKSNIVEYKLPIHNSNSNVTHHKSDSNTKDKIQIKSPSTFKLADLPDQLNIIDDMSKPMNVITDMSNTNKIISNAEIKDELVVIDRALDDKLGKWEISSSDDI